MTTQWRRRPRHEGGHYVFVAPDAIDESDARVALTDLRTTCLDRRDHDAAAGLAAVVKEFDAVSAYRVMFGEIVETKKVLPPFRPESLAPVSAHAYPRGGDERHVRRSQKTKRARRS